MLSGWGQFRCIAGRGGFPGEKSGHSRDFCECGRTAREATAISAGSTVNRDGSRLLNEGLCDKKDVPLKNTWPRDIQKF